MEVTSIDTSSATSHSDIQYTESLLTLCHYVMRPTTCRSLLFQKDPKQGFYTQRKRHPEQVAYTDFYRCTLNCDIRLPADFNTLKVYLT